MSLLSWSVVSSSLNSVFGVKSVSAISCTGLTIDNGLGGHHGHWTLKVVSNVVVKLSVTDSVLCGTIAASSYLGPACMVTIGGCGDTDVLEVVMCSSVWTDEVILVISGYPSYVDGMFSFRRLGVTGCGFLMG